MTLSSAEKTSNICPWRFPDPTHNESECSDCILEQGRESRDRSKSEFWEAAVRLLRRDRDRDMGNVSPSIKAEATVGSHLIHSENRLQQQQSELNSKQRAYKTLPAYIQSPSSNFSASSSDKTLSARDDNSLPVIDNASNGQRSPSPVSNGNIRLTMDVNNSRPTSRSSTPILSRKPAMNHHRDVSNQSASSSSNATPTAATSTMSEQQNRSSSNNSLKDSQAKDIMISYSHLDKDIMLRLKDALEAHNISVWVDVVGLNAGVNFLNKIGQAIIDSKMFITLLTERTLASKFCQDELALAYISNKPIFPVSIRPQEDIFPKIPTGMKLQLARFEWTQLSVENFDRDVEVLLDKLKACLDDDDGAREEVRDEVAPLSPPFTATASGEKPLSRKPVLKRRSTRPKLYHRPNRSLSRCNSIIEQTDVDSTAEFWDRNFDDAKTVQWERFEAAFMKDYEKQLSMTYASSDKEWFIDILKRELEVEDMLIHKEKYKDFISEECDGKIKEQPILKCVNELAVENYTMKEVFNMDSSVRIDAINNLSKFGSVAVVEALLDLLDDQEHDVRASACISLAKSKAGDMSMKIDRLMRCLRDTDRFVRESACIALGYLKAESAVSALLQIWRNDYISSVRDTAEIALKQIGGDEVNRAMQMTKVLTSEIEELIKVLTGKTTSPKNGTHKKWGPMKGQFNTLPPGFTAQHSPNMTALTLSPVPNKNTL